MDLKDLTGNEVKVRAHAAPWNAGVEFLIVSGTAVAKSIVMEEHPPGMCCQPSFSLDYAQAQTLMDDLWVAGLRPTEGTGSAGALAATQRHLDDMRTLVFQGGKKP